MTGCQGCQGTPGDVAVFSAQFSPVVSGSGYSGRNVAESVYIAYENCWGQFGGPYGPVNDANFNDSYTWNSVLYDEYGYDRIGDYAPNVGYYQAQMGAGGTCTDFSGSQAMSMSHCENPLVFTQYDSGHTFALTIINTGATSYRGNASGPNE